MLEGQVLSCINQGDSDLIIELYIQINQISLNDFARENIRPEQLIINVHIPFPRDSEKSYLISDKILESEQHYQYVLLTLFTILSFPLNSIVDKL